MKMFVMNLKNICLRLPQAVVHSRKQFATDSTRAGISTEAEKLYTHTPFADIEASGMILCK